MYVRGCELWVVWGGGGSVERVEVGVDGGGGGGWVVGGKGGWEVGWVGVGVQRERNIYKNN